MASPYRTLLCPTDLSPAGDGAVALAYALAQSGGTVHLLHVSEPAYLASPFDMTPVMLAAPSPEALLAADAKAERHLKGLVPQDALTRGVRTETHIVTDVGATSVIQRVAKDVGADAIVMGSHGRSGWGKLVMGSVASDVLRHAALPVILARPAKPKA